MCIAQCALCTHTHTQTNTIVGLICRIASLLQGSFAKETYDFINPTNQSHPIYDPSHTHCAHTHTHKQIQINIDIHTHTHAHTHTSGRPDGAKDFAKKKNHRIRIVYAHTHTQTHKRTHIHTQTHTNTQTHTHTHTCANTHTHTLIK